MHVQSKFSLYFRNCQKRSLKYLKIRKIALEFRKKVISFKRCIGLVVWFEGKNIKKYSNSERKYLNNAGIVPEEWGIDIRKENRNITKRKRDEREI